MSTIGKPKKIVRLNLTGGAGLEAVKIGRYLRNHNITTWTDAKSDICASACNRVFAGCTERIYSSADHIQTGKNLENHKKNGLGYHHPNINGDFQAAHKSNRTVIAPYMKEMLPPSAYQWVHQADESNFTRNLIWLNGREALELGISTSNKAPLYLRILGRWELSAGPLKG
ncbi:hypothetical protein [Polynucleobacter arcticus]|uniref:Uncharacterized protein n=1 Tax=Polynucleobacter arcticus TaxID=1743165 RepID=A0A6M9PMX6_9BURK|nr:hypothetical protein [Polynucleobacter arcticus]QKM60137.1 hypothetical protein DN92_03250 [Polynucleobacter arcticus]